MATLLSQLRRGVSRRYHHGHTFHVPALAGNKVAEIKAGHMPLHGSSIRDSEGGHDTGFLFPNSTQLPQATALKDISFSPKPPPFSPPAKVQHQFPQHSLQTYSFISRFPIHSSHLPPSLPPFLPFPTFTPNPSYFPPRDSKCYFQQLRFPSTPPPKGTRKTKQLIPK